MLIFACRLLCCALIVILHVQFINTSLTSCRFYSLHAGEVTVSVKYRRDFEDIQGQYAQLFDEFTEILENDDSVTLDKLKRFLSRFPDLNPLLNKMPKPFQML